MAPMAPTPTPGGRGTAAGSSGSRMGQGYTTAKGTSNQYGDGQSSGYDQRGGVERNTSPATAGHGTSRQSGALPTPATEPQGGLISNLTNRFRRREETPPDPRAPAMPSTTPAPAKGNVLGTLTSFFKREPQQAPSSDDPIASKHARPAQPGAIPPASGTYSHPDEQNFPTSPSTPIGGIHPGSSTGGSSSHGAGTPPAWSDEGRRDTRDHHP